jgi:uncharacterized phage protein gp47/JayE
MPYQRDTLSQLVVQTSQDLNASLPGADALLPFSLLGVLALVQAGGFNANNGYLDWIAKQCVPWTATGEFLEGWGALKGVTRKPATVATGSEIFPGLNGAVIPAGTPLALAGGQSYVTTAAATVTGGVATVSYQAVAPGSAGNAPAGVSLTLGTTISGVQTSITTANPIAGGVDAEDDDALRQRMLQVYAQTPQGGARSDYVDWALEVPGVTRAWVAPEGMGPGTVIVYFMMDVAEKVHGGFPQGQNGVAAAETRVSETATGDQLSVANYIYGPNRQPVTALVYATAPNANTVNFTISGLANAGSTVQSNVAAAISAVFLELGSPGSAVVEQGASGVVDMSAIEGAIVQVSGTSGFVITSVTCSSGSVAPGSAGNITSNPGYLPVLGSITWS